VKSPKVSLKIFEKLLKYNPNSIRAQLGKARALDRLSKVYRSNEFLHEAVDLYEKLVTDEKLVKNPQLYIETASTCVDRMRFLGFYKRAVLVQKYLVKHFPNNAEITNQLAILLLMSNRLQEAKQTLQETLQKHPNNGVTLVHYGFVLKQLGDLEGAVKYLSKGIKTNKNGTEDGLFYLNLGDALNHLNRREDAAKVFESAAAKGLFLSSIQRSLYNVNRLKSKPFWTEAETTNQANFRKVQMHWKTIADEGVKSMMEQKAYLDEAEGLKDKGTWKQFELYSRGRKLLKNCEKAPKTCELVDQFEAAKCTRGQVKFSVMLPETHVWPHCGPTNCRIRAHLGLVVPSGTFIRVGNETRSWEAGKWLIFDDSFEHEVWHNGTSTRLVLIIDIWHPDLTDDERQSLAPI